MKSACNDTQMQLTIISVASRDILYAAGASASATGRDLDIVSMIMLRLNRLLRCKSGSRTEVSSSLSVDNGNILK